MWEVGCSGVVLMKRRKMISNGILHLMRHTTRTFPGGVLDFFYFGHGNCGREDLALKIVNRMAFLGRHEPID